MASKRKKSAKTPKAAASRAAARRGKSRLYTLEVLLTEGLITEEFDRKNPVVSRTIEIRGDQTLEDLHYAIFEAFDRFDEHMYEFQFDADAEYPDGRRYVIDAMDLGDPPDGMVDKTTLDSLGLRVRSQFAYWFDFGDDWWHKIKVVKIDDEAPSGKYPRITKRVGESPAQYPDLEDEDEGDEEDEEEEDDE